MAKKVGPTSLDVMTLAALARLGAGSSFTVITSSSLGDSLGLTQQAASRRLLVLEEGGMIQRAHSGRGLAVKLTQEGLGTVRRFYNELTNVLEPVSKEQTFVGRIFSGLREGAYYVSLRGYSRPFQESLGFTPFPGTLNLRLSSQAMIEQRSRLSSLPGIQVPGFHDARRTFGPVKCFRAKVGGKQAGVLAIERSHYDDSVIEVISPVNLRKTMSLDDGDELEVTVLLD